MINLRYGLEEIAMSEVNGDVRLRIISRGKTFSAVKISLSGCKISNDCVVSTKHMRMVKFSKGANLVPGACVSLDQRSGKLNCSGLIENRNQEILVPV